MRAAVYLPGVGNGPGRLTETCMKLRGRGPATLELDMATVRDESGEALFEGSDLVFDPSRGGGPLAETDSQRQARAFAVVNTAFHVQRALRFAAALLGRPLPHLLVRIGLHRDQGCWGGGHYRLPSSSYSELPETGAIQPTGEVHLGYGRAYLASSELRYFHVPGHNASIIYHEVGHHICRHTADFRLNRLLPAHSQTNRKIALDEGTSDYLCAVLLGRPDIYGWHRSHVPEWQMSRRCLSPRWTMASFHGGRDHDPHADGTIWASALWSARIAVAKSGFEPSRFDAMVLRGLDLLGAEAQALRTEQALRRRRYFSALLEAIVATDNALRRPVLRAMKAHGIVPGASNASLRDLARAQRLQGSLA